jgi:hypothetical protein
VINRAAFCRGIARKNPQLRQGQVTPWGLMAHHQPWEATMVRHRIIAASSVLLAVTIGSAAAQQETSAGKPLQILQFARHGAKAPLHPRARTMAKLAKPVQVKRHIAKTTVAKHHKMFAAIHSHAVRPHKMAAAPAAAPAPEAAQPTPAAPPATMWPAVNAAAPATVEMPVPPAAPQNVTTEQVVSDAPDDIAANGRVPPAAVPVQPNDPPAETHAAAVETPAPAQSAPPETAAVAQNAAPETAAAPAQNAAAEPVVRAMVATPDPAESNAHSPIGSATWMMQVLAALGGAVAAGAVAWFLILRGRHEPEDAEFFSDTLVPGE